MVNADEFKGKIEKIISQDFGIGFFGDDFNKTIKQLTETKANSVYSWVEEVKKNNIVPIMKNRPDKKYKGTPLTKILSFRKEITISGNDHRIMLIKIKADGYIEFHIGKHKYYDKLRRDLGLTEKKY